MTSKGLPIAAVFVTAVIFVSLVLGGCVTQRHIREVRADIARLDAKQDSTQVMVNRVDSTIAAGHDEDSRLRASLNASAEELGRQIAQMQEQLAQLMEQVESIRQKPQHVIVPSGGSQSQQQNTTPEQPATAGGSDCLQVYDSAFVLVLRGDYEPAIGVFQSFLGQCPQHENVANAHYWIGECNYAQDKFAEAIADFDVVINDHPSSSNLGRALFKKGQSLKELDRKDEARETYQRVLDEFPNTLEGEQAKDQLRLLN